MRMGGVWKDDGTRSEFVEVVGAKKRDDEEWEEVE